MTIVRELISNLDRARTILTGDKSHKNNQTLDIDSCRQIFLQLIKVRFQIHFRVYYEVYFRISELEEYCESRPPLRQLFGKLVIIATLSNMASSTLRSGCDGGGKGTRRKPKPRYHGGDLADLRACMMCALLKKGDEFEVNGCDNCEVFLKLAGRKDMLDLYTSKNFDGMLAVMEPKQSWVAKWQRIDKFKPGLYAVSVSGVPDQWIIERAQRAGIKYVSRDKAVSINSSKGKDEMSECVAAVLK